VLPWSGLRDATRPGPRCIQDTDNDFDPGHPATEDCLTLSVWTPPPSKDARPVMVWIHGGSFINSSADVYDARRLASRGDIVVVTLEYRLGALGFLAHPALGPAGQVGNYGLADQQAALRWVRDNIANFGGDPGKVTLAGESAGGMSVCDHLVAPGSAGLFRAAIIHSAPCQAQGTGETAEKVSLNYAAEAGCGDPTTAAQCLARSADRQIAHGAVLLPRQGPPFDGADHRDRCLARRSDQRVRRRSRRQGAGADRQQPR
jgi:para-nitrobenzyl esterase